MCCIFRSQSSTPVVAEQKWEAESRAVQAFLSICEGAQQDSTTPGARGDSRPIGIMTLQSFYSGFSIAARPHLQRDQAAASSVDSDVTSAMASVRDTFLTMWENDHLRRTGSPITMDRDPNYLNAADSLLGGCPDDVTPIAKTQPTELRTLVTQLKLLAEKIETAQVTVGSNGSH